MKLSRECDGVLTSPSTSTRIDTDWGKKFRWRSYDGIVQLPESVRRIIEERAAEVEFAALRNAAAVLSESYRAGRGAPLADAEQAAAYLAIRMPATWAAAFLVLEEVRLRLNGRPIASILDVGAGTGAASLAARQWFPGAAITMVERDRAAVEAAREWLGDGAVVVADANRMETLPPHDLVMAAYSLGEMRSSLVMRLWRAARVAMVVIEPGTTAGFSLVRNVRAELLQAGARMVAPCPAEMPCPMASPDWCHFAARVERSRLHRQIKNAALGYEDEKFSYVALAREPVETASSRVIARPQHRPGLIVFQTCTAGGLGTARVTKRDREAYRAARKTGWGDAGIS